MTTVFDVPADLPILLKLVFTKKENQKMLIGGM